MNSQTWIAATVAGLKILYYLCWNIRMMILAEDYYLCWKFKLRPTTENLAFPSKTPSLLADFVRFYPFQQVFLDLIPFTKSFSRYFRLSKKIIWTRILLPKPVIPPVLLKVNLVDPAGR